MNYDEPIPVLRSNEGWRHYMCAKTCCGDYRRPRANGAVQKSGIVNQTVIQYDKGMHLDFAFRNIS